MTTGRQVVIGLAVVMIGACLAGLIVSCWQFRRRVPPVPVLPPAPRRIEPPDEVPVILLRTDDSVQVACPSGGRWLLPDVSPRSLGAVGETPVRVGVSGDSLTLQGRPIGAGGLELRPEEGLLSVDGRSYRGHLLLRVAEEDELSVVNVLPTRQYLWSVVGSEMYSKWRLEALMAQAVAARTYLVYALDSKPRLNLMDMAYKGVAAESSPAKLAVDVTSGIVLTYEGRILPAYFHSTCGGHTVPVDRVFDVRRIPPLSGVACRWCRRSPAYTWQARVGAALLAAALSDRGVEVVRTLRPKDTGPAGYARSVAVNGQKQVDATAFRLAVGGDVIKSTRFRVERSGGEFLFSGRGYGHGVGLCQWGAHGLSEDGRSWEEILSHYYPGSHLQKAR